MFNLSTVFFPISAEWLHKSKIVLKFDPCTSQNAGEEIKSAFNCMCEMFNVQYDISQIKNMNFGTSG